MASTITKPSDIPQSVPMFLRKTYHMIDSCDPAVACWSEDGETFVVKDPSKFESEIIPQFFKHSKFTSFVRQLNFYSFRKIKYVDTIRLDPKLEAETANFWRFRHEKFQRGKPHLLTEIKRMTASQNRAAAEKAAAAAASTPTSPDTTTSSSSDNTQMKQEIDTLKKQLEEMNKNMTELTSMVQKVSLNDSKEQQQSQAEETTERVHAGSNKRKKVEFAAIKPEPVVSTESDGLPVAEATLEDLLGGTSSDSEAAESSSLFPSDPMEMDAMDAVLGMEPLLPQPNSPLRASSTTSNMTDSDFVDQLFDVFGEEGEGAETDLLLVPEPTVVTSSPGQQQQQQPEQSTTSNHPDPELMDRLSEALAVLPKEMQHQIVNRLIDSITSNLLVGGAGSKPADVVMPLVRDKEDKDDQDGSTPVVVAQTATPQLTAEKDSTVAGTDIPMPLAAATLTSLLSYYSKLVKENEQAATSKTTAPAIKTTIPVIPCHA